MARIGSYVDPFYHSVCRGYHRTPEPRVDPEEVDDLTYEANLAETEKRNKHLENLEAIDTLTDNLGEKPEWAGVVVGLTLLRDQLEREYEEGE